MKYIKQHRESLILLGICLTFIFSLMAIMILKPRVEAKQIEPIQYIRAYEVTSYSESVRMESDREYHDTTINYVDSRGLPETVTVTDRIESTLGTFGKLISKDSVQLFVGTTDPAYSGITEGNNIAYAKYIAPNEEFNTLYVEIDEEAGERNFMLNLKE